VQNISGYPLKGRVLAKIMFIKVCARRLQCHMRDIEPMKIQYVKKHVRHEVSQLNQSSRSDIPADGDQLIS